MESEAENLQSWLGSIALIRATALLREYDGSSMPIYECSRTLHWKDVRPPDLVLFVSHRWRTPHNPDPDGAALMAIRRLLSALDSVARGIDPTCDLAAPDLRKPYMLQASILFGRLLQRGLDGESALDATTVFYDYSCLPQGAGSRDREFLLKGLSCFPDFIPDPRVTLVALRSDGDNYGHRAWCVAESVLSVKLAQERTWADVFPLRLELSPVPFQIADQELRTAVESWSDDVHERVVISRDQYFAWRGILDQCAEWFSRDHDGAARQLHHTGLAADVSFRMFVETMIRLAEHGDGVTDLVPAITGGAVAAGIECLKEADLVPTGLLILAGLEWERLNRGEDQADPDVWTVAFKKYCSGLPLKAEVLLQQSPLAGKLRLPRVRLCE